MQIEQIINRETKILAIVAHPDDFEDYWGGTILQMLDRGQIDPQKIYLTIATNGAAGGRVEYTDAAQLAAIRKQEQLHSLSRLGLPVENLAMWDFQDGQLNSQDTALLEHAVRQIRQIQPDIVLTHKPQERILHLEEGDYYVHRDHREIGSVVLDAVYPFSRDLLFFPHHGQNGGNGSHTVTKVLLSESSKSNIHVDITEYFERKLNLFAVHASQVKAGNGQRDYFHKFHKRGERYLEEFEYLSIFN